MKKLLLALLCFGLVACTPKQPEPVPEDKTLKIVKNENIDSINPIYLRKSQAEREYEKRMGI